MVSTAPLGQTLQRLSQQLGRAVSPPAPARAVSPWEHLRSKGAEHRPGGAQSAQVTVATAYNARRDEIRHREQRRWDQQAAARRTSPEQQGRERTMGARMGRLARGRNQVDVRQHL